ncbi:hypothetical protein EDF66_103296 [Sphingobacterium sp. JUb20]|nr:hypothetical protein [Sphingobacterium sp. JUb21]TCR08744.1 hypothetical protein EDF66_103296 [Sphingobacterium sp. JUb20]
MIRYKYLYSALIYRGYFMITSNTGVIYMEYIANNRN